MSYDVLCHKKSQFSHLCLFLSFTGDLTRNSKIRGLNKIWWFVLVSSIASWTLTIYLVKKTHLDLTLIFCVRSTAPKSRETVHSSLCGNVSYSCSGLAGVLLTDISYLQTWFTAVSVPEDMLNLPIALALIYSFSAPIFTAESRKNAFSIMIEL